VVTGPKLMERALREPMQAIGWTPRAAGWFTRPVAPGYIGVLAATATSEHEGPFFHGTKADLRVGDFLTAGYRSNYRPEVVMNHIYFTALRDGAGLAAELAAGDGAPRAYAVEPTGAFVDDPNVTDKKFPATPPGPTAAAPRSGSSVKPPTGRG
jgi:hypothetical protein